MDVSYPYRITDYGLTDISGDHVRQMIEQVLLTSPGERVYRPDFGAGLAELVFAPAGDELIAATQVMVQAALQRWLGDVIKVEAVVVERDGSVVNIRVRYTVLQTQQTTIAELEYEYEGS